MKCFRCHKDMSDLPANYPHVPCDGYKRRVRELQEESKKWFCALEPSTAFDIYWWIRNSAPPAEEAIRVIDSNLGAAAARGIMAERNSDNLDLLTLLRDKVYSMSGVPNTITVGGEKAVISDLNYEIPDLNREGRVEFKYLVLRSESSS